MQVAERSRVTSGTVRLDRLRPESWIERRGESLRALRGREVYRAEAGGIPVVVKEYAPRLLDRLFRSYAEVEADGAIEAARRGLPCVEPLAWARLADGRQILLLREEAGARPLRNLVLEGCLRARARHDLARRVGDLLARMQNAGVRHRDLHAGNVLVRPDGSVLLADARSFRFGPYLRVEERASDLADFSLFFLTHATRVDLLLFWGAYARASGFLPPEIDRVRRAALALVPQAFARVSRGRAAKWRRSGRPVGIRGFSGIAAPGITDEDLSRIVDDAAALREGPHVLKRSRTAWTFRAGEFVAKVYLPKKATRPLRDFLFGTRPERSIRAAQALLHRGIPTPEPVAALRDGRFPDRSILVLRRAEEPPFLDALRGMEPLEARAAVVRLGRLLRRMHDFGLRHRDLKASNLRMGGGRILLLDLDGVREAREVGWPTREKDLAHLARSMAGVPTTLLLRGLDAYAGRNAPGGFAHRVAKGVRP